MSSPSPARQRRRVRNYASLRTYVRAVQDQVHPRVGISNGALEAIDAFVDELLRELARIVNELLELSRHRTLTSRDVQTAARLLLPGELAKHAVSEGTKAVVKYNASGAPRDLSKHKKTATTAAAAGQEKKRRRPAGANLAKVRTWQPGAAHAARKSSPSRAPGAPSKKTTEAEREQRRSANRVKRLKKRETGHSKARRAGLRFPVSRVRALFAVHVVATHRSQTSAVYLAAVLEYLTAELLELAGNLARDAKRKRTTTKDLAAAIRTDGELSELTRGWVVEKYWVPTSAELAKERQERAEAKRQAVEKRATAKRQREYERSRK
jgi:histone H2B